jgi:phosphate/phosphite/phosphonate ABC transporter binding protein
MPNLKCYLKKIVVVIGLFFFLGCSFNKNSNDEVVTIDVQNDKNLQSFLKKSDSIPTIKVAVSSMLSPKETHIFYQDLFRYMSKKLGYNIEFIQRKTYQEVNNLLIYSKVDLALICSGAYIENSLNNNVDLLVVPTKNQKPYYNSYIITNKENDYTRIEDLEGKEFAFTDPLSNTGALYPKYLIKQLGKNPNTFFSKTIFSYGHDISMQLVSKGIVDGASIDALIFEYNKIFYPERIKYLKIINQSPDFGIPPLVVPKKLDAKIKRDLKTFFLNIHKDSTGNNILKKLLIEKFIIGFDHNYNSIRDMNQALN